MGRLTWTPLREIAIAQLRARVGEASAIPSIELVRSAVAQAAAELKVADRIAKLASVPALVDWAQIEARRRPNPERASAGDLVVFAFRGAGFDHIAMIDQTTEAEYFACIEACHGRIARTRRRIGACPQMVIRWDEGLGIQARAGLDELAA